MGLERQYMVCKFGMKAEIRWSLKRRGEICWSLKRKERHVGLSSRPVSSPWVFSGYSTTSQKGSPPQMKDMCELSLTVSLLHTNVAVEELKYKLYFYISTSSSLFVQRFNMQHKEAVRNQQRISGG